MPHISWNDIQDRAAAFASRWTGETCEKGESQSLRSDFLAIYNIDRVAEAVLDARDQFPGTTLADLYDPLPNAYAALDRAVDRLYRTDPFETDADRGAAL